MRSENRYSAPQASSSGTDPHKYKKLSLRTGLHTFVEMAAALLLSVFDKAHAPVRTRDLKRLEFKSSTQLLGVRFTERIRQVFRHRWLRRL